MKVHRMFPMGIHEKRFDDYRLVYNFDGNNLVVTIEDESRTINIIDISFYVNENDKVEEVNFYINDTFVEEIFGKGFYEDIMKSVSPVSGSLYLGEEVFEYLEDIIKDLIGEVSLREAKVGLSNIGDRLFVILHTSYHRQAVLFANSFSIIELSLQLFFKLPALIETQYVQIIDDFNGIVINGNSLYIFEEVIVPKLSKIISQIL